MMRLALWLALVLLTSALNPASAQTYSQPWIVLGDSITNVTTTEDPRLQVWPTITQERAVQFRSLGAGGAAMGASGVYHYSSADLPSDIARACGAYLRCAGVVIQAGLNDWLGDVPWSNQATAITNALNFAQTFGKKVLMVDLIFDQQAEGGGQIPNGAGLTFDQLRTNRYLMCAAKPTFCTFALRPAGFNTLTAGYYQADGRHLTPAGWRAYATWIEGVADAGDLFGS